MPFATINAGKHTSIDNLDKRPPLNRSVKDIKNSSGTIHRAHENHGDAASTADPKYSPLGHDQFAAPVVRFDMLLLAEAQTHLLGSSRVSVVSSDLAKAEAVNDGTIHQE